MPLFERFHPLVLTDQPLRNDIIQPSADTYQNVRHVVQEWFTRIYNQALILSSLANLTETKVAHVAVQTIALARDNVVMGHPAKIIYETWYLLVLREAVCD